MENVLLGKIIFSLCFILFFNTAKGQDYHVKEVIVDCVGQKTCKRHVSNFKSLVGKTQSKEILKENVAIRLLDDSIEHFSMKHNAETLYITIVPRKRIGVISVNSKAKINISTIEKRLEKYIGEFFFLENLKTLKDEVKTHLEALGHKVKRMSITERKRDGDMDLIFDVEVEGPKKVALINFVYKGGVKKHFSTERALRRHYRKSWNATAFKNTVALMNKNLFLDGFLLATIIAREKNEQRGIVVDVEINLGEKIYFVFTGNKTFNQQQLKSRVVDYVRSNVSLPEAGEIKSIISKRYEEVGLFGTEIEIKTWTSRNQKGHKEKRFLIDVNEGKKVLLDQIVFMGNEKVTLEQIQQLYDSNSSVLASRSYLDLNFLKGFKDILKKMYLERGFLFADVNEPYVEIAESKKRATVKYKINERQQCLISDIQMIGVTPEIEKEIRNQLKNRKGLPLDVTMVERDFDLALKVTKEHGYFFSTLKYNVANDILRYSKNYSRVEMVLDFTLGKKVLFDSVLVSGVNKTKSLVIEREINLSKGDFVTPKRISEIKDRLGSLGLFSYIRVTPIYNGQKGVEGEQYTDLLVQVKEKKFGSLDAALGYRTDLGYRAAVGVAYNNLLGKNHTASFKLEGNRRDSYRGFDQRRRSEEKPVIEFTGKTGYSIPHIFPRFWGIRTDFNGQLSWKRKRFYSFDADIKKVAPSLALNITDNITFGLSYQLETIKQYDATLEKDNDRFQIGSISPTLALDFRDDPITPKSGAFFGLSWERANPSFGSVSDESLEVNYSKIVSRNKFYLNFYPIVFATSISLGVAINHANEVVRYEGETPVYKGYIPTVKVFRLAGPDLVRGFEDNEINILDSGRDISDIFVNTKAYFTNIKFEPRYFFNDKTVFALFFDAGRIFVDHYRPIDLRASTGISLKLLTPVGSLNFDYGVKLKRESLGTGGRETFGKFHLSIGFF